MKKNIILILSSFLSVSIFGQNPTELQKANYFLNLYGEVNIDFSCPTEINIDSLSRTMSIDNVRNKIIQANLNRSEFESFLKSNLDFQVVSKQFASLKSASSAKDFTTDWDSYPRHSQYVEIMQQFAVDFPELCQLDTIGMSINGKPLLVVKISGNVKEVEPEARFFYSASIHGDEVAPFVFMIRLIHHLLNGYGKDLFITKMVDNLEIWINPLANPDGMYPNGSDDIINPIRRNAAGIDLNRNFPDPVQGDFPTGAWQPETEAMIDFHNKYRFSFSANLHTGEEVVNFPWDVYMSSTKTHADVQWFGFVSEHYADSAHQYGPENYMKPSFAPSGVVNGGDWYVVYGGRQDFVTYFTSGREITVELDTRKITPENELPLLWEANYRSFYSFIEQATYGLTGIITNKYTKEPVEAKIEALNHDMDNSHVYSRSEDGFYIRHIYEGTYDFMVSAPGFDTTYINQLEIKNFETKIQNIELVPSVLATISGNVMNAVDGNPVIADISVLETNDSIQFDFSNNPIDGTFAFQGVPGEYSLHFKAEGFRDTIIYNVSIDSASNYSVQLDLLPVNSGFITGKVFNENTKNIEDVSIELVNIETNKSVFINNDSLTGEFRILAYSGEYSLRILKEGFMETGISSIVLEDGREKYYDFGLVPILVSSDAVKSLQLKIAPNPVPLHGQLFLHQLRSSADITRLQVFNVLGKEIYRESVQHNQVIFSIQKITQVPGIFIFVFYDENMERIIKKVEVSAK